METLQNFQLGNKVKSNMYGIGTVIALNDDNSFRVEYSSGLRPVYWNNTGLEYNPMNERDTVISL
jgi:hypothetical protein